MGYCNCHDSYIPMHFELAEVPRPFLQWPGNEAREMLVTRLWIFVLLYMDCLQLGHSHCYYLWFPHFVWHVNCLVSAHTSLPVRHILSGTRMQFPVLRWMLSGTSDINFKPPFIVKRSFRSPFHLFTEMEWFGWNPNPSFSLPPNCFHVAILHAVLEFPTELTASQLIYCKLVAM